MDIKMDHPKTGRTNLSVVENIYSIIDSKIQYLDYKTKELVRPLIGEDTSNAAEIAKKELTVMLKIEEELFLHFEKQSKMKKLLLLLKNCLDKDNALLILSLLAEDQLVRLSQTDLEYRLGISTQHQAA